MKFLLTLISLICLGCASTAKARAAFNAIDTFGSPRLTDAMVNSEYGTQINELGLLNPQMEPDKFGELYKEITSAIQREFGFAAVELGIVSYYFPKPSRYVTVDVVETKDVADRMSFLKPPTGRYKDPDEVLALWDEYFKLSFSLIGSVQPPPNCPVWHCFLGFEDARLAPYLPRFNSLVRKHESALVKILKDDARSDFRASAAFLLAHSKDGNKLVHEILPSIFDSSETVRNNVMRVLTLIAAKHPEIFIPVESLVKALHFPATTDRNKASSVLESLSRLPENKLKILSGDSWTLIDMLKLQQPNNHDPAYNILKNLSGQKYGERDYMNWETWMQSQVGGRP